MQPSTNIALPDADGGVDLRQAALAEALFAPLVPDLRRLAEGYRVNTSEVDAELLEIFFQQLRLVVDALQPAVAGREVAVIRQGAHSLQGMGGTIGVPELSVVGAELSAAAQCAAFDRCRHLVAAVVEWMRRADPAASGMAGS